MNRPLPLNTSPLPVRLRVEDYLMLDAAGAFSDYAKTELIEGEIVYMNAQHRPHALAKMEIYDRLRDSLKAVGSSLRPLVEASVSMSADSAPEPDIVLTSEPKGKGLIPLQSVALIVEISDTTLKFDITEKLSLYAQNGVPEYWVVDVEGRTIHQMWAAGNEGYAEMHEVAFGERIKAATIEGLIVETEQL